MPSFVEMFKSCSLKFIEKTLPAYTTTEKESFNCEDSIRNTSHSPVYYSRLENSPSTKELSRLYINNTLHDKIIESRMYDKILGNFDETDLS